MKNFICIGLVALSGLGGGAWIALEAIDASGAINGEKTDAVRLEDVNAQMRIGIDALWSSIETLRVRAIALQGSRGTAPLAGIAHWAELAVSPDGAKVEGVAQSARSPKFQGNAESLYQTEIASAFDPRAVRAEGVAVLPYSVDGRTWLAFAFPVPAPSKNFVVSLVDPTESFLLFRRWARRGESGTLRGYLVKSDGRVLAHSLPGFAGADFSSQPIFKQALASTFRGERESGFGTYDSIDHARVAAAYAKLGGLPLALVVERALKPDSFAGAAFLRSAKFDLRTTLILAWVLVMSLLAAAVVGFRPRAAGEQREIAVVGGAPAAASARQALKMKPIVAMPPELDRALAAVLPDVPRPPAPTRPSLGGPLLELVERFESEVVHCKDAASVARRLAEAARRALGGRALFFGYHAGIKAGVLQAAAGFQGQADLSAMTFPVDDATASAAIQGDFEGTPLELGGYGPLARLLLARAGTRKFRAWALTGPGPASSAGAAVPKLLGVLVSVGAADRANEIADAPEANITVSRMLRATGLIYESTRENARRQN